MAYVTGTVKSDIDGIPDTNRSPSPGEDEDKYGVAGSRGSDVFGPRKECLIE